MAHINGTELVLSVVGRWNPGDLAFVERLEYTAQMDEQEAAVVLVAILQRRDSVRNGWPSEQGPKFRVKMRFLGVQQFHIREFGGPPTQIMGFDILDVSERGWEGIRFSVEDYEHDRIRFFCKKINIINVEPA